MCIYSLNYFYFLECINVSVVKLIFICIRKRFDYNFHKDLNHHREYLSQFTNNYKFLLLSLLILFINNDGELTK